MTLDELRKVLADATPGKRVQFHPDYCPEAKGADVGAWDTSHDTSVILPDGTVYRRYARHRHACDASLDALAPRLAADLLALVEDARAFMEAIVEYEDAYVEHSFLDPNASGDEIDQAEICLIKATEKAEATCANLRARLDAIEGGSD